MKTFKEVLALLSSDFGGARCDLAAMAITHIETLKLGYVDKLNFYIMFLGYSLTESAVMIEENKLAYKYMKNSSFKTSELISMARSI